MPVKAPRPDEASSSLCPPFLTSSPGDGERGNGWRHWTREKSFEGGKDGKDGKLGGHQRNANLYTEDAGEDLGAA